MYVSFVLSQVKDYDAYVWYGLTEASGYVPVGYLPNRVRNSIINTSDHLIHYFMLSISGKGDTEAGRKVRYIGPYFDDARDAGKVDVVYLWLTETWNHMKLKSQLSQV